MDLNDLARLYDAKLLRYQQFCRDAPDDETILRNTVFTTRYFIELCKRWAERRYVARRNNGVEMTIEEADEKSDEAARRFFRSQARKQSAQILTETMSSNDDELFAFLAKGQGQQERPEPEPAPEEEPEEQPDHDGDEGENGEADEDVPEPAAAATPEPLPDAPTKPGEHVEYPPISPEEFARIRRG